MSDEKESVLKSPMALAGVGGGIPALAVLFVAIQAPSGEDIRALSHEVRRNREATQEAREEIAGLRVEVKNLIDRVRTMEDRDR